MMQLRATAARVRAAAPEAEDARAELLSLVGSLSAARDDLTDLLTLTWTRAAVLVAGLSIVLLWCCRRRREKLTNFRGRLFMQLAWPTAPEEDDKVHVFDVEDNLVGWIKGSLCSTEGPAQLQVSVLGTTVSAQFGVDERDEPRVLLRADPPAGVLPTLGFPAGQPASKWAWELVASEPPGRSEAPRPVSRFLGAGLLLPLYALQPAAPESPLDVQESGTADGSSLRPAHGPLLRAGASHAAALYQRAGHAGALLCRRGETTSEPVYAIMPFKKKERKGRPRRFEVPAIRVVEREQGPTRSPEDAGGRDSVVALAETDPGKPGHIVCTCAVGGAHHEEDLATVVAAVAALLDLLRLTQAQQDARGPAAG